MNPEFEKFMNQRRAPEFAVACEMIDGKPAARGIALAAPASAAIELAKLLTEFEDKITDERRALLIRIGAGLLILDDDLGAAIGKADDNG